MLRLDYGSPAARVFAARIARCIRDQAYLASAGLAAERGVFPPMRQDRIWSPGPDGHLPPAVPPSGGTASGTTIWFRSRPRAASALPSSTIARPASSRPTRGSIAAGCASARPRRATWWRRIPHGGSGAGCMAMATNCRPTSAARPISPHPRISPCWRRCSLGGCRDFEDGAAAARVHGGRGRRAVPASLAPGKGLTVFRPDPRMPAVLEPARHEGQTGPAAPAAA